MKGFTTKAIHGAPLKQDAHGTLRMAVYDSVAFEHATAEDMQAAFEGRVPAHSYSRISNPTVEDYEQRVRLLADALLVVLNGRIGDAAIRMGRHAPFERSLHVFGSRVLESHAVIHRHAQGAVRVLFERRSVD